jgi:hypothetical protein
MAKVSKGVSILANKDHAHADRKKPKSAPRDPWASSRSR